MTEDGSVTAEISNGICSITFFHPQSNSLPGNLLRNIAGEISKAGSNDAIKVIVLQSKGEKTFCAGASFDELLEISDLKEGLHFFSGFAAVINAMRKAPKFIIARVQGKAVGGGAGIAAAADYALAHESASVKLSELAVGIGPFVVGPAVERKIGKSAFLELAINATAWKTAVWAKQKGLFAEVYTTIQDLDKALADLTAQLSKSSPEAMQMLKKIFWEDAESWDSLLAARAAISGKLVLSDFAKQAIEQFKSKN